jgi:hypothetical protein
MKVTVTAVWLLAALAVATAACAGDSASTVAARDEPSSTPVDETDLPVTFDSGMIRFDPPPPDVAPRMTKDEAYRAWVAEGFGNDQEAEPQVAFGVYSNFGQGRMTDAGVVHEQTAQPAWMVLFHNVSAPASGGGSRPYSPGTTPTTGSGPPPTYIVDSVGFMSDVTGAPLGQMTTKIDRPDHAADQPPGAPRSASCPADFSQYEFRLSNREGSPEPWPYNAATPPRGAIHGSNGDAYEVFGGVGSFDHPLVGEMGNLDSPDGVIVVRRHSPDPCRTPIEQEGSSIFHHEPSRTGAVTLTALEGDVVRYRTAGRATGSYNVVTDTFAIDR